MSEKVRKPKPFKWDEDRLLAAQLLAEDELSDVEIAAQVGVTDRQMRRWKESPEFMAKITEFSIRLVSPMLRRAIAKRARRVRAQDERWLKLLQLVAERAADPKMQGVPGGKTGLLAHTRKGLGNGDNFQVVDEYEFDAAVFRELRDLEKHAAQEVGQWAEKLELSRPPGPDLKKLSDDKLDLIDAIFGESDAGAGESGTGPSSS